MSQYVQLITPNANVPCMPGWCLKYVQDTYGIGAKYPSAIAAWNASQHKHADLNFPNNVWVPVWFSLSDNPNGHVVLRAPDGSVYSASSPTSHTPVHHASLGALDSYYGAGRLKILGWTEDVEDTLVIEEGVTMSPEAVNLAFAVGFNRQATQDEINQWEGKEPEVVLQTIYNNNQEFRARADQYDAVVKQLNASGVTSADQDKLIAAITAAIKQFLGTN